MNLQAKLDRLLLPYQRTWIRQNKPNEIMLKARRTGMTWTQALKMVLRASTGVDQNIVSHTEDGSKLVIQDVRYWVEWLADNGGIPITDWDIQITIVRHKPSGAVIRSLPSVPRNIRGKKGDVFIDEAAWIPCLEELIDACQPLKLWGGRISLISSSNPANLYWTKILTEASNWSVTTIDLPSAVEQGLYDRIRLVSGYEAPTQEETDRWVSELLRDAGSSAGREYLCEIEPRTVSSWIGDRTRLVSVPVISLTDADLLCNFRIPQPHIIGVDVGTESAPTAIAMIGLGGELLGLYLIRKHRLPQIESIIGELVTDNTTSLLIDTNGIGRGTGEHLRDRFGTTVQFCPNHSQWINRDFVRCLGGIWDGSIEGSDDPLFLSDLKSVSIVNGKVKIQERSISGQVSHGDTVVALAIAHTGLEYQESRSIWDS